TTAEYCVHHAQNGMVNVMRRKQCGAESYGKQPSLGVGGTRTVENCAHPAQKGMVNISRKMRRTEGSGRHPSFGVAVATKTEYCAQYTRPRCDAEGYTRRDIGSNNSGEKTIVDASLRGVTQQTALTCPNQASLSSGGCGGSRKRARHLDIESTTSQ
ncbi:unnamed protein product, partial [Ascophyllum nodosum]